MTIRDRVDVAAIQSEHIWLILELLYETKIKKSEAHLFNVRHQRLVQARFHGKPGQHNTHCFSALYYVGWVYLYRILKSEEKNISIHKFYILEGIKA